jgi:hypothetical protein
LLDACGDDARVHIIGESWRVYLLWINTHDTRAIPRDATIESNRHHHHRGR